MGRVREMELRADSETAAGGQAADLGAKPENAIAQKLDPLLLEPQQAALELPLPVRGDLAELFGALLPPHVRLALRFCAVLPALLGRLGRRLLGAGRGDDRGQEQQCDK